MTPKEYTEINLDTTPTTKYKAERLAEFFSIVGLHIYVMRDTATGFYRALPSYLELETGLELVEIYFDGKVLEMAF